jgi:phage FluMu protein Com
MSTVYKPIRCKECGELLWSDRAKELQLCPECENVDENDFDCMEDRLENLLK